MIIVRLVGRQSAAARCAPRVALAQQQHACGCAVVVQRWQPTACSRRSFASSRGSSGSFDNVAGAGGGGTLGPSEGTIIPFRPRRRPARDYRPTVPKRVVQHVEPFPDNVAHKVNLAELDKYDNDLESIAGPLGAQLIQDLRQEQAAIDSDDMGLHDPIEEKLRYADYLTTEPGTTEERIFERRIMESYTEEEKKAVEEEVRNTIFEGEKYLDQELEDDSFRTLKPVKPRKGEEFAHLFQDEEEEVLSAMQEEDPDLRFDQNRKAHGEWSEYLINVRRSIHNWRGGRLQSFRAMLVGGNGNGCAGFGVGQSKDAIKAVELASREARKNIFFVDRYMGERLTRDLVGMHNNTKVVIRASHDKQGEVPGLRGNVLIREILKRFGITQAQCKAIGPRHPWNVVYATFKAIRTHESLEEIALKTGKRLVSVDKALRLRF